MRSVICPWESTRPGLATSSLTLAAAQLNAQPLPHDWNVSMSWQVAQAPCRGSSFSAATLQRKPSDAPPETQKLFRHDRAHSEFGASIFWVNAETSFADTEDLIIGWQTRRDLQRRGIVEVIGHDRN